MPLRRMCALLGLALPAPGTLPPKFSILFLAHLGFRNPFLFSLQDFNQDGSDLHWTLQAFAPPGCLTLLLCPQWHCPLGCAFAILDTPGPLPFQIRSSRLQECLDCPQAVLLPWSFTDEALLQDACFIGAWLPVIVAQGASLHGSTFSCLGFKAWTSLFVCCLHCSICAVMTSYVM